MTPLSAQGILSVWEAGKRQHLLDRGLTLLHTGYPTLSREALAQLSVGERDAYLLLLRRLTFGDRLESFAVCPACQERLEFALSISELQKSVPDEIAKEGVLRIEGFEIAFRLPNSRDLAAIVSCATPREAHQVLLERCIVRASREGETIGLGDLPEGVLEECEAAMAECDPQAELRLELTCPTCSCRLHVLLDIVSFFWLELTIAAKRLLREVHVLASTYGWREVDILAMSVARRQAYLELVS